MRNFVILELFHQNGELLQRCSASSFFVFTVNEQIPKNAQKSLKLADSVFRSILNVKHNF